MKILITGAAGKIGKSFTDYAKDRYEFKLMDLISDPSAGISKLDISDLDSCRDACEGVDVVLHLAADSSPEADFHNSLLSKNILGTFNVFRAATDAGCRRVVFASSIHTVDAYPLDERVKTQMPRRPQNAYGVSKCFGEDLGAYFAYCEDLSTIAVRIGYFKDPAEVKDISLINLRRYISPRDLCQLLIRCIEVEDVTYAIVNGISDNRVKRLDLSDTKSLLGYEPEDDAFELFNVQPESNESAGKLVG